MNLTEARADESSIQKYIELFAACFPGASHYKAEYLRWLYRANPAGAVVGFDAWDGEILAAHYACVPARMLIGGRACRALLSLNTATHPSYQGKGLFTKLAAATYEHDRMLLKVVADTGDIGRHFHSIRQPNARDFPQR